MLRTRSLLVCVTCAAFLGGAAMLIAGPLDPPAGTITSTGKKLADVEPRVPIDATNTPGNAQCLYRITSPGSYYLAANIVGEGDKNGIEITCSGVTVDLMGFELLGSSTSRDAVFANDPGVLKSIVIRNGIITGWGKGNGINLGSSSVRGSVVSDIVARENGKNGISVGSSCTITRCSANYNEEAGIYAGGESTIRDCTGEGNTLCGIYAGSGSTINGCTVFSSAGDMATGIKAQGACTITDCTSSSNNGNGIETTRDCIVTAASLRTTEAPASRLVRAASSADASPTATRSTVLLSQRRAWSRETAASRMVPAGSSPCTVATAGLKATPARRTVATGWPSMRSETSWSRTHVRATLEQTGTSSPVMPSLASSTPRPTRQILTATPIPVDWARPTRSPTSHSQRATARH
jgi:hypothetical protein